VQPIGGTDGAGAANWLHSLGRDCAWRWWVASDIPSQHGRLAIVNGADSGRPARGRVQLGCGHRAARAIMVPMKRATWPLSGRDREATVIRKSLISPRGGVVVLIGDIGVGKSRLARDAAGWLHRRGRRVTWVQANGSLQTIPWGVFGFVDVVETDPLRLFRMVIETIGKSQSDTEIPLLVCDDAHLLDDRSAAVVNELAIERRAVVLLTVRDGEPVPDAVRALMQRPDAVTVRIEPLERDAVAPVLTDVLGGRARPSTVDQIFTLTKGNFLYLRELVDGEIAAGRLTVRNGEWSWQRDTSLPQGLSNVIGSRLDRLDRDTSRLVDLLAVGGPLPCRVYERLVDLDTIVDAEQAGLAKSARRGDELVLEFAHPLYAELARQRMGMRKRMHVSGLLATAWDESDAEYSSKPTLQRTLRVAGLRLDSDTKSDPAWLSSAAASALVVTDLELAERLTKAALDQVSDPASLTMLAFALSWQAKGTEAEIVLDALDALWPDAAADSLTPRAGNLFWPLKNPSGAVGTLESYLDKDHTNAERAAAEAMLAAFEVFAGNFALGKARADRVDHETELSVFGSTLVSWALSGYHAVQGEYESLARVAERGYATAAAESAATICLSIAELHLLGARITGRIAETRTIAHRFAIEAAWSGGIGSRLERRLAGLSALIDGRIGSSIDMLTDSAVELESLAPNGWLFGCVLDLAQALALAGDAVRAREMLLRARSDMHPAFAFMFCEVDITEALVLAAEGKGAAATARMLGAAESARGRREHGYEALALAYSAQLGSGLGADRLAELEAQVDGPRVAVAARHALALAANDAAGLESVGGAYVEIGERVAALDAISQASAAFATLGDQVSARRLASRARSLANWAEGAHTMAYRRVMLPPSLTARESEIVRLAADGMPNKEIASVLGISVRTVEGHLYRASGKLGGATRSQLNDMIDP
jgi:DNA-binding CsgD family transcriptional regulator